MELKDRFIKASEESKQLPKKPDNDTLLELYALFKQGNEGDVQGDPPSNPFDIVARAKYQAWEKKRGLTQEAAMQQYIDLVEKLKSIG